MRLQSAPARTLFRLGGMPVRIDATFVIVPITLLLMVRWSSLLQGFSAGRAGLALAGMLLGCVGVFGSILLHELGHALVARRFGYRVLEMRVGGFYGFASIVATNSALSASIPILLAGPLVNGAIALWLWALLGFPALDGHLLLGAPLAKTTIADWPLLRYAVIWLFSLNLALALINLLPAFPLDGGRILRVLLRRVLRDDRAVTLVCTIGFIVGIWCVLGMARYGASAVVLGILFLMTNLAIGRGQVWPPDD